MQIIRTFSELAVVIARPPDPTIATLLQSHADRLAEYEGFDLPDLALFAIIDPGDDVEVAEASLNWSLLDRDGGFIQPVELIARHPGWYEATFVLSDDGFGFVLFVPIHEATEPRWLTTCELAFDRFALDGNA